MKYKKKGQGAIEFVIIFSAFLFFFILFFYAINENVSEKNKEKEGILVQNIALNTQSEINLAARSSEGYYREFSIPQNILGKEYQINISGNRIILSTDRFSSSYKIIEINGTIKKGTNTIRKQNGTTYLN